MNKLTLRVMNKARRARLLVEAALPSAALGPLVALQVTVRSRGGRRTAKSHAAQILYTTDPDRDLDLTQFEYRVTSQNGEDGILAGIFAEIGFTNRKMVEFGFAATEATVLDITLRESCETLFMDASSRTCRLARSLFRFLGRPNVTIRETFITAENINGLLADHGFTGSIDLLSIDIDGNDYWVWQALTAAEPRVVVIEFNDRLGPDDALTITYEPGFDSSRSPSPFYQGASLKALEVLAAEKGYRLVCCDSAGVNAFFIRADVSAPRIATKTTAGAFRYHQRSLLRSPADVAELARAVEALPFVRVR